MAVFDTARSIYLSVCDDPGAIAAIQAAASALALSIATDGNASGRITSASMNGQSFTMVDAMPPADRLKVLRMVLKFVESGQVPSKTETPKFT